MTTGLFYENYVQYLLKLREILILFLTGVFDTEGWKAVCSQQCIREIHDFSDIFTKWSEAEGVDVSSHKSRDSSLKDNLSEWSIPCSEQCKREINDFKDVFTNWCDIEGFDLSNQVTRDSSLEEHNLSEADDRANNNLKTQL